MKRTDYLLIFIVAFLLHTGVASLQRSPGFMDAEYYLMGGRHLIQGEGFKEYILWNYLDDPSGIPHPSHTYWMPLAAIISALGMLIFQSTSFAAAQSGFVLVGSLLAPLTAYLCFLITQKRASAIFAGGLGILTGFYAPFMTTSDTFGIYAVLGALFFILLASPTAKRYLAPLLLGLIAGLMHLSRTDGMIWLGLALIGLVLYIRKNYSKKADHSQQLRQILLVLLGYLVVMGPWFARNLRVTGSLMAPGGMRSLWIIEYNEVFIYPASQLTLQRWFSAGLETILQARTWALGINLQRSLAEQGMIFLAPLILLGLWRYRRKPCVQLGLLGWILTLAIMTLVFPYQGARGGFFHSSAAFLSLLWALAPAGLDVLLEWAQRTRGWKVREPRIVFSIALLFLALCLTAFSLGSKMLGREGQPSQWEENRTTYQQLEATITERGAHPDDIVLTTNAPGYFVYNQRRAISIPEGEIAAVIQVAQKYGGKYLLLEENHPNGLDHLYENPETQVDGLQYLTSLDDVHIFIIE